MIIDCDTCVVRGPACGHCVVTVLLGAPPLAGPVPGPAYAGEADDVAAVAGGPVELDRAEQAAIAVLAGSGLVPPLRLVPGEGATAAAVDPRTAQDDLRCRPRGRAAEAG